VQITEPGEWRVRQMIDAWRESLDVRVRVLPDTRFVCPLPDFFEWAAGRKQWRMEYFYRDMRRKTGLLMDGDKPVGGKWNFDADNRGGPDADCDPPPWRSSSPMRSRAKCSIWSPRASPTISAAWKTSPGRSRRHKRRRLSIAS
jgi:deoxyribodipyrimidine photolyase-like uncharacterized protein